METKRVVFIGGLADGAGAIEILLAHPDVELVRIYTLDEEEGAKSAGYFPLDGLAEPSRLRKVKTIRDHAGAIQADAPDIIFVIGFSQIIPPSILAIPPRGVVGFHSAILPGRRGCSPVIWAIAEGLTETGVTMFFMDEGIDSGDIIDVEHFPIEPGDAAAEVLAKADGATWTLLKRHLDALLAGTVSRTPHTLSDSTYTRRRTPDDGEINWGRPAREIVNQIRALSPPYPMAHTFGGDGEPILIEKAHLVPRTTVPEAHHKNSDSFRKRVLCVVAHPDDEVLGVGATLALHAEAGGEVMVVILSEGEAEKFAETPSCETRRQCARKAAKRLGIKHLLIHDLPDQRLDAVSFIDILKPVESAIAEFRPDVIYTHHHGDANTDHQVVFKAVYAATRPMSRLGKIVSRVLAFETPSSTEQAPQVGHFPFNPTSYIDVEPVWEKKTQALMAYPEEMIGGTHPRGFDYIEALARIRGGQSGFKFAEAFLPIRERLSHS